MFEGKSDGNFEDRQSDGESKLWCETGGQKENRRSDVDVGIEGNSCSDSKSEWSKMLWACVKEE